MLVRVVSVVGPRGEGLGMGGMGMDGMGGGMGGIGGTGGVGGGMMGGWVGG